MVTINELARMVIDISGKRDIRMRHVPGPQGVRGRNSDNTRLREVLGWEPGISLEEGIVPTYEWIERSRSHGPERGRVADAAGGAPGDPARRRPRRRRQRHRHGRRPLDEIGRWIDATASSTTCASPACTASWRASATRSC